MTSVNPAVLSWLGVFHYLQFDEAKRHLYKALTSDVDLDVVHSAGDIFARSFSAPNVKIHRLCGVVLGV